MTIYFAQTYTANGHQPPTGGVKPLHGGKGAGLIDMTAAGLPVPEALILTTAAWKHFRETGELTTQITQAISNILDAHPASMFSVRSGAPISMPGMMDTVLNVGVDDEMDDVFPGAYKRFATAWLGIVKAVPKKKIATLMELVSDRVTFSDMTADPSGNAARYRKLLRGVVQHSTNIAIPDGRYDQIIECVKAVFKSWDTPRAKAYRAMHNIPEDMGTACIVQRMVMGTAHGLSGSGVMFSRDPATGEHKVKGEIAFNAQGEEVVSGEVTPTSLDDLLKGPHEHLALHDLLTDLCANLENHFKEVQDIEFTVEDGKLYVLQTRTAKMSARARIITACDLATQLHYKNAQGRLSYIKARVTRGMIAKTMTPTVVGVHTPHATGLAASPGAISGRVVFADTPLDQVTKDCILVAKDTTPDDFPVMAKCGGIFTSTGGFTCHSAVVARGIGVPAVVGCDALKFTTPTTFYLPGCTTPFSKGSYITIDGATGAVYPGQHKVVASAPPRAIYQALYEIVQSYGSEVPEDTYFLDCGIGDKVVLPLNFFEPDVMDRQIARATKLTDAGKTVAFSLELEGLGEDMFAPTPDQLMASIADHYGPDLKGKHILYGVPTSFAKAIEQHLGMTVNTEAEVSILDLLDLLGEAE